MARLSLYGAIGHAESWGWVQLELPVVSGFDVNAIIQPGWHLHFFEAGTDTPAPVYADNAQLLQHSAPVKIDRFANFPSIYLYVLNSYDIVVKNEYNVHKYLIENL